MPKLGILPDGFHALFWDLNIRFLSKSIDEATLRPLMLKTADTPRLSYEKFVIP